jgi:hypothetical protein
MPRECTVCAHPDSVLINEALVLDKVSNRGVARQYGVDDSSVQRHRKHIPEMLARASRAEEIARADTLLDRIEELHRRTEAVLSKVEQTDNYSATLAAIREMRNNLELIGEVTKELSRQPTLNLELNAEWVELKTAIFCALRRHPAALQEVRMAIEGSGGNGRQH